MIIVRVMGGLGNQLQQYALFRKFQSLGVETKLDLSWFSQKTQESAAAPRKFALADFDGLSLPTASGDEVRALLGRAYEEEAGLAEKIKRRLAPGKTSLFEETQMYHPQIFSWQNRYLVGYWACEAYYADILNSLREEIRFPESGDARNREVMAKMAAQPRSASMSEGAIIWMPPTQPCSEASVRKHIMTLASDI